MSQQIQENVELLHSYINSGKLDQVKNFVATHPRDKHYYNRKKESAAAQAIKLPQTEIYDFLISHGIHLGPHEQLDELVAGQPRSIRVKLNETHTNNFKNPNIEHLTILNSKVKLSHETSVGDLGKCREMISKAFNELNNIRSIKPLLEMISTSEELMISFDFTQDSVERMNLLKKKNVFGTTDTKLSHIQIGAKGLKSAENRCAVLGTLIHEICHFAMEMVYNNGCKPYMADNLAMKKEFEEIVDGCKAKDSSENIIARVFKYTEDKWHAELIVRVPHMLAYYKDNDDGFPLEFDELFEFYQEKVLPDLKREFPIRQARHALREVNERSATLRDLASSEISLRQETLNFELDASNEVLIISTNCLNMAMLAIYQKLKNEDNFDSSYIFMELRKLKSPKMFDLLAKTFKTHNKSMIIVDCGDSKGFEEIYRQLGAKQMNSRIIFVTDQRLNHQEIPSRGMRLDCSWNHFSKDCQDKLLDREIIFQSQEVKLKELNCVPNDPNILTKLIKREKIEVGKELKFENIKTFVERKFLVINSMRMNENSENCELDVDKLFARTKVEPAILLFDEPGMGKSIEMKMITKRLKQKFPSQWIVFLDLKEFSSVFQKDDKISITFENAEDIFKFFLEKILKVVNYDAEVFTLLFNAGRCVFLFDGFDEICPSYKKFVMNLISGIQETSKNQFWISTRPHLVDELKAKLKPVMYKLKPFTTVNRNELFEKLFLEMNLSAELSQQKLSEIENFMKLVTVWSSEGKSLSNPLLLQMIATLFEDPNFNLDDCDFFSIYDKFTRSLVKICNEKGPEGRTHVEAQFGDSTMTKFHYKMAFKTLCNGDSIESHFQFNSQTPSNDVIARVGLLYFDGSGKFHFIHRTFAEFYVAKYIYEKVFKRKYFSTAEFEFILKSILGDVTVRAVDFEMVYKFLEHKIQSFDCNNHGTTDNVKAFIEKAFEINKSTFFNNLIVWGCINLIGMAFKYIKDIVYNSKERFGVLMTATRSQSNEFIEKFWEIVTDSLDEDSIRETLSAITERGDNLILNAVQNKNEKVFGFFMTKIGNLFSKNEFISILEQENDYGENLIYHILSCGSDIDNRYEMVRNILVNYGDSLTINDKPFESFFDRVEGYRLFKALHSRDRKWEKKFAILKEILSEKKLKKLLRRRDKNSLLILHHAIGCNDEGFFQFVKNIYDEKFGNGTSEILLEKGSFCHVYDHEFPTKTFPLYLTFVQAVFENDRLNLNKLFAKEAAEASRCLNAEFFKIWWSCWRIFRRRLGRSNSRGFY